MDMNWRLSIPAIFQNFGSITDLFPLIQKYFDGSGSLGDLTKALSSLPTILIRALEHFGAQRFPALAPEFHVLAVLTSTFHADRIMWFQEAYNELMEPAIPLEVDGVPGPKTDAAILALQAKFGLPTDGWLGKITSDFIKGALEKKFTPTPTTS